MKSKIIVAALLGVAVVSGYAVGQNSHDSQTEFLDAWTKTLLKPSDTDDLIDVYAKMPGNMAATKIASKFALDASKQGNDGPALTTLVMQNQKIIEQDTQIAALLAKIAAKK